MGVPHVSVLNAQLHNTLQKKFKEVGETPGRSTVWWISLNTGWAPIQAILFMLSDKLLFCNKRLIFLIFARCSMDCTTTEAAILNGNF